MSEVHRLTSAQQDAVLEAITLVLQDGRRKRVNTPDGGQVYVYPCLGGIAWTFSDKAGTNIARGVWLGCER